jgi:hypothetical protein
VTFAVSIGTSNYCLHAHFHNNSFGRWGYVSCSSLDLQCQTLAGQVESPKPRTTPSGLRAVKIGHCQWVNVIRDHALGTATRGQFCHSPATVRHHFSVSRGNCGWTYCKLPCQVALWPSTAAPGRGQRHFEAKKELKIATATATT